MISWYLSARSKPAGVISCLKEEFVMNVIYMLLYFHGLKYQDDSLNSHKYNTIVTRFKTNSRDFSALDFVSVFSLRAVAVLTGP